MKQIWSLNDNIKGLHLHVLHMEVLPNVVNDLALFVLVNVPYLHMALSCTPPTAVTHPFPLPSFYI